MKKVVVALTTIEWTGLGILSSFAGFQAPLIINIFSPTDRSADRPSKLGRLASWLATWQVRDVSSFVTDLRSKDYSPPTDRPIDDDDAEPALHTAR